MYASMYASIYLAEHASCHRDGGGVEVLDEVLSYARDSGLQVEAGTNRDGGVTPSFKFFTPFISFFSFYSLFSF